MAAAGWSEGADRRDIETELEKAHVGDLGQWFRWGTLTRREGDEPTERDVIAQRRIESRLALTGQPSAAGHAAVYPRADG